MYGIFFQIEAFLSEKRMINPEFLFKKLEYLLSSAFCLVLNHAKLSLYW